MKNRLVDILAIILILIITIAGLLTAMPEDYISPNDDEIPKLLSLTSEISPVYSSNNLTLCWSAVEEADAYRVYMKNDDGSWILQEIVPGDQNSYTMENQPSGCTYTFTVRAESNGEISGCVKDGISIALDLPAPALDSISSDENQITFTWEPVEGATGYRIYQKIDKSSWGHIDDVSADTNSFTTGDLSFEHTYTYTVRCEYVSPGKSYVSGFDPTGVSLYLTSTDVLQVPDFSVFASAEGNVVEFDAVPGATRYIIYRKDSANAPWREVGSTDIRYDYAAPQQNAFYTYIDSGVYGTDYYYSIAASNAVQLTDHDPDGKHSTEKLVVMVGDGITLGSSVYTERREKAWPALVGTAIADEDWSVLNCGYSGSLVQNDSSAAYAGSRFHQASLLAEGDIYIITVGANDAVSPLFDAATFREDLEELVSAYRQKDNNPRVYLCLPPASYKDDNREEIYRDYIFPIIREFAWREGLYLIDLHTPTAYDSTDFTDGLYPNTAGNERIAEIILNNITPALWEKGWNRAT